MDHAAVIGLGYVGTSTIRALLHAGFEVRGFDISPDAVASAAANLAAGYGPSGDSRWIISDDPAMVLAEARTVLLAVRLERDPSGQDAFRTDPLERVALTLDRYGCEGALIIIESTVEPGTTRRFADSWLHLPGAEVVHAPERLRIGDNDAAARSTARLVGGVTPSATTRACEFLQHAGMAPIPVSAPEVSELAKLLENAFLTTGISLVGEITRLAHRLGVPAREVTDAAATKPHGYFPFHPGAGIGGHCLRNDLDLLRHSARTVDLATPMLDSVAQVAAGLPRIVVDRLMRLLDGQARTLAGVKVLLVGVGFKIGSPDVTETPAVPIARALRAAAAVVSYIDAQVPSFTVDGTPLRRVRPEDLEGDERWTAALILAGDRELAGTALSRACDCLLDTGGGSIMVGGIPDAAEQL